MGFFRVWVTDLSFMKTIIVHRFTLLPGRSQCHLGLRMLFRISGNYFLDQSSRFIPTLSASNELCFCYSHKPPRNSESHLIRMKHILQILIFLFHFLWTKGKQDIIIALKCTFSNTNVRSPAHLPYLKLILYVVKPWCASEITLEAY